MASKGSPLRLLKRGRNFLFLTLLCSVGYLHCTPSEKKLETAEFTLEKAGGGRVQIAVEIARTEAERARGLMHRISLPDGEGMLFVFERDQILSFWMKDTLIPLSIAFISYDGRIREIYDMHPRDLRSIHSSRSVRYALEVPQGWFERTGITVGDRLHLR
ncbi:MAG: DUF192 domain-containing protein [Spirochaetaceae bacterium]|jgi:uncharacterized membrane protein (UPF0127 family)|nr:DUF192 domain-containing protein [Spirochaetaceae bacterium]